MELDSHVPILLELSYFSSPDSFALTFDNLPFDNLDNIKKIGTEGL